MYTDQGPGFQNDGHSSRKELGMKACLWFVLLALTAAAADRLATVIAESAPVYSNPRRSEDEIVKSLKRGDRVSVQLSLTTEDGEWCAVSEPDQRTRLGFLPCRYLRRETAPKEEFIALPPQTATPDNTKTPAVPERVPPVPRDPATRAGEDYMRPIRYWETSFRFTAEQQAAVNSLAGSTGVTNCRRQYEAHYRAYAPELALAQLPIEPRNPTPAYQQRVESMVRDLNRFLYPCQMKILELLERFPALMTPEQRSNSELLASFQKQLADQRRVLTSPDMYRGIR